MRDREPQEAESLPETDERRPSLLPVWLGYLLVVLADVGLTAILLAIEPVFPKAEFRMPFVLVTGGAAYFFGLGPALLSIVLAILGYAYAYVPPIGAVWPLAASPADWAELVTLLIGTLALGGAMLAIRRLTARLREALREARENERRYSALFNNKTNSVAHCRVITDERGKPVDYVILEVNHVYEETIGVRKEDIEGRRITEVFPGIEHLEYDYIGNFGKVALEGGELSIEVFFEPLQQWLFIYVFSPKQGEFIAMFIDITERVRAEKALARALDEARRDRQRLEAMEEIADAGISTTELDKVLDAVAERIAHALGMHSCTISLLEDTDVLVAHAAYGIPELCGFSISADEEFAGKILTSRRTTYIGDAQHDPMVANPHIKRTGVRSLLGTPLIARGRTVGLLYVDMLEVREFSPEERRLLEAMASRTALIVENARLYEQLAKSRDEIQRNFSFLQRSLLPPGSLQVGPGYHAAAAYLSPFGLEIGGDFYDAFGTEAGKHGILIGDVEGKGVAAVSLATTTRSTIRALAYDIPSAGEALTHANSVLSPQESAADESAFITALVAVIDPATGEFRYASAGHPPPAIYHSADGAVEFLEVGGPPLRIEAGVQFEEYSSHLLPGDRMVLYTDGLSEARRDAELFGIEGIQRVLQQHGRLAPEDLVARLIEAASTWAGGNITDDTAVVVVEREA